MRIGIVIPTLHGGGAELVARRWISELDSRGHAITVYAYDRTQPAAGLPAGVTVRRFTPRWPAMRRILLPFWLRRQIDADAPDGVVSLLTYSNLVTLLALTVIRKSQVPLLVSEHTIPSLHALATRRRVHLTRWLACRMYRRAAGVIAVSHPVAGELVSAFRVSSERIFVIANPVLSSPVSLRTRSPAATSRPLQLAFVGRQVPPKRPGLFVDVLRELAERDIPVRGSMIGDGPLRERTEREALDSGLDILFTGWREPWWDAVPDIDCLVLTARFEGLANVLVEAAAAGIPSVACSRALGVADAIVPGLTGELTLTDSPRDYADAVMRATSQPLPSQETLGRWLEHLSVKPSTTALLAAFQAVVDAAKT
ncbi:MAG TPA: glycosyltransferase [Solirubrobacteraceae bacterium]|nr:glycosyltransferase [Solirubrobacteraceae bacterium]